MEYNTQREKMNIPEYGRNVQKMIEYAITVEDREERNKIARYIVSVMANMHPEIRENIDYEHKLWDHMHIIANYRLDVDGPYPKPEKEAVKARPDKINYSEDNIRYKHYGKNVEKIIETIIGMEDGEEKDALIYILANHMKKSYLIWNRDAVTDDVIFKNISELSHGKITVPEGTVLLDSNILAPQQKQNKKKKSKKNSKRISYFSKY